MGQMSRAIGALALVVVLICLGCGSTSKTQAERTRSGQNTITLPDDSMLRLQVKVLNDEGFCYAPSSVSTSPDQRGDAKVVVSVYRLRCYRAKGG